MRHLFTFALGLALLAGCGAAETEPAGGHVAWGTDLAAGIATAKKTGKTVLVNVSGSDWCGWCIKLDNEVFAQPAFATWAKDRFVLVNLDFPRDQIRTEAAQKRIKKLGEKYGVAGFPTVLFLDGEGELVAKTGYVEGGGEAWTAAADKLLKAE